MNLQTKLEMLMKKNHLTKAQLSKNTNLPYTTINSILKRDKFEKVKISTMNTLKNYFNVSLDYLMVDDIEDMDYGKYQLPISQEEYDMVIAYRNNPNMQPAVKRILGLDTLVNEAKTTPKKQNA